MKRILTPFLLFGAVQLSACKKLATDDFLFLFQSSLMSTELDSNMAVREFEVRVCADGATLSDIRRSYIFLSSRSTSLDYVAGSALMALSSSLLPDGATLFPVRSEFSDVSYAPLQGENLCDSGKHLYVTLELADMNENGVTEIEWQVFHVGLSGHVFEYDDVAISIEPL